MFLVVIIIVWDVLLVMGCISVFVKYISAEVVVFEYVLSVASESVVEGNNALTESVDEPFWLQVKLT